MCCASVTAAVGICLRRHGMDAHSRSANPEPMLNSRWIVVACFLTFGCAQPKPESVDKPAKLISGSCTQPEYPAEAIRAEQTGDVRLKFFIDSKGIVTNTSIDKSTGFPILDNAAASALGKCHFEPAVKEGIPVESEAKILYVWKLAGPDPCETPPKMIAGSCQLPRYASEGDGEGNIGAVNIKLS